VLIVRYTVEFTAGQLRRPAENIEHGRLNAAMQRSAITRNNVGRVAQETEAAPAPRKTGRNIVTLSWARTSNV